MTASAPNPALRAAALLQPSPQPPLTTRDLPWLRIIRIGALLVILGVVALAIVGYFNAALFSEQTLGRLMASRDPAMRSAFLVQALSPAVWLIYAAGLWLIAAPRDLATDRRVRWSARRVLRMSAALFGAAFAIGVLISILLFQATSRGPGAAPNFLLVGFISSVLQSAMHFAIAPLFVSATLHARSLVRVLEVRGLDGALGAALLVVPLAYLLHLILLDAIEVGADSWLVIVPTGITNAAAWAFPVGFAIFHIVVAAAIAWRAHTSAETLRPEPLAEAPHAPPPRCLNCDYDLTTLRKPTACPECGAPVAAMQMTDESDHAHIRRTPSRFTVRLAVDLILFELIARGVLRLPVLLADLGLITSTADAGRLEAAAYNLLPLLGLVGWWLILGPPDAGSAAGRVEALRRLARLGLLAQAVAIALQSALYTFGAAPGYEANLAIVAIHLCGLVAWWFPAIGRLALLGERVGSRALQSAAIGAFWLVPACFFGVVVQGALWDGGVFDSVGVILGWVGFLIDLALYRDNLGWAASNLPDIAVFAIGAILYVLPLVALRRAIPNKR